MKRFYALLLSTLMAFAALGQSYVQIGSGEVSTSYPVYGAWYYTWHSAIYPAQAEIGSNSITHIAFSCNNGPKTASNQKIYLKLTDNEVFSNANYEFPEDNGYTLVFEGDVTFDGWTQIDITDFAYDGTSNIILHWENRHGNFNYQYPNFNSTTSSVNNNKGAGSDMSFPSTSGYLNPYPSSLPNIRFYYEAGSAPETPSNELPENGAQKVDVNANLQFTLGTNTTSYDLYLSTSESLVTNFDESAALITDVNVSEPGDFTYTPDITLAQQTEYFWRVVAKNETDQTASPVFSFETQRVIESFPYTQGFEDEEIWTEGWYGDLSLTDWFYTTVPVSWNKSGEGNGYTGNHSAVCNPSGTGGEFILMTPRVNVPANHYISFWWRNNSPVVSGKIEGQDVTFTEISTDGGDSWTELGALSPAQPTDWAWVYYDLSAYAGDNVYIRWRYARESDQSGIPMFIDDVLIDEISGLPEISLSESSISFPELAIGGSMDMAVTISNIGTSNLSITSASVDEPFYCNVSVAIAPGQSEEVVVSFEPNAIDSYSSTLTFNVDGDFTGDNTLNLSGSSIGLASSFYQGFDASTSMPTGWNAINSPTHAFTKAEVKADQYGSYSAPNAVKFTVFTEHNFPVTLVTPGVDGFDQNTLTFYAKKGDALYDVSLLVGLMDNPYDANSFEEIQTIEITDEHQEFQISFPAENTKPYIAFRHSENTEENSVTSIWIDEITWDAGGAVVPEPAQVVFPVNGASDIDIMKALTFAWANGGGSPSGYKLSLGTNAEANNIIENVVITGGTTTTYTISQQDLDFSTTYNWQIVPFNENGDAVECPVWSFTTMDDPTVTSLPFFENFDNLVNESGFTYPLGWSIENVAQDNLSWDVLSNSEYSPNNAYSAPNAMHIAFHPYNAKDDYLFTPPIELEASKTYSVSFMLQTLEDGVTGLVYTEKIKALVGSQNTSDAMSIEVVDTQINELGWVEVSGTFNVPEDASYFVAFHGYSDPDQYLLIIDDVKVDVYTGTHSETTSLVDFSIYPNPANSFAKIILSDDMQSPCSVKVYSVTGQLMHSSVYSRNEIVLNTAKYAKGVYVVAVDTPKGSAMKKLIVK